MFMPLNEAERLRALRDLDVLDSQSEKKFDALVQAAALVCGVPISLVSLIDADRQWFKANVGLPGVNETPRDMAFCAHAILEDGIFEVPDATADPRFADNPLVRSAPDIRFYAGATLRLNNGAHIGTLCVIDRVSRQLTPTQREVLRHLATVAVEALETRRLSRGFVQSEARFRALSEASPLGVFATDTTGACTYTNARWQAIYGLTLARSLEQDWSRTLHPDDRDAVLAEWQRTAALHQDFDMEFRVRRDDGSSLDVRCIARPVNGDDGKPGGHVGSVEDVTERLRIQRALTEEGARLAALIDGTGAGTWEWNVQTGELRVNRRWADIIGKPFDELGALTNQFRADLAHPDELGRTRELLREHFAGRSEAYDAEVRLRHRDGHWVWVQDRGRVVSRMPDGKPEWMFGTHVDISKRKQQEEVLRRRKALLDRTEQMAQVGGWELNLRDSTLVWSAQTRRLHEVDADFVPQVATAINFYAPMARPVIAAALNNCIENGTPWDLELPLITARGRQVWARAIGNVETEDGKPVRLAGCFQDITARRHAEAALRESNKRFEVAADAADIGVWEYDVRAGSLVWDDRMFRMYGLNDRAEHQPYALWTSSLHPEDKAGAEQALNDAIEGGAPFDTEFRIVLGNGEIRHLQAAAHVERDAEGAGLRMIGINLDVTTRAHMTQALLKSNAELEHFAHIASHDLQEPLRMVANYTELLAQRYQGQLDEKADKYIFYAVDGARRMQRMVADLMAYSRVGSQGGPLAAVNAAAVVQRVLQDLQLVIVQAAAQIDVKPLPMVLADAGQLGQVFQNLIGNAIKFRAEAPLLVTVSASRTHEGWQFTVADNGIGIDQQYADRIFQMFQRLHERGKFEGSGIGLAVVKRIIERHGGRIWVDAAPGRGSTFFFTLKSADAGTARPER